MSQRKAGDMPSRFMNGGRSKETYPLPSLDPKAQLMKSHVCSANKSAGFARSGTAGVMDVSGSGRHHIRGADKFDDVHQRRFGTARETVGDAMRSWDGKETVDMSRAGTYGNTDFDDKMFTSSLGATSNDGNAAPNWNDDKHWDVKSWPQQRPNARQQEVLSNGLGLNTPG